jgi:cytochrome c biogenesis protein CcdA/DsbC/DsbD-like thiol-disulfide interchange protein/thioredoxin-related protein
MTKQIKLLSFFVVLLLSSQIYAQVVDPVKWTYDLKKTGKNQYDLIFRANIEDGWHLYTQDIFTSDDPEKIAPNPLFFSFEADKAYKTIGKTIPKAKAYKEYDPMFEMELKYYKGKIEFVQKVQILAEIPEIKGYIEYQLCDNAKCIFLDTDFSFAVDYEPEEKNEETTEFSAFASVNEKEEAKQGILDPVNWSYSVHISGDNEAELIFTAKIDDSWHLYAAYLTEGGPKPTSFHFEDPSLFEIIEEIREISKAHSTFDSLFGIDVRFFNKEAVFVMKIKFREDIPSELKGYVEYMVCDDKQCLPPVEKEFVFNLEQEGQAATSKNDTSKGLIAFFLLAFLVGLGGVLTPCVYPMIPMTVSYFMNQKSSRSKGRFNAVFYGLSIIFIYTVLGLIIAATLGPEFISILSTHWLPNILFFLLFTIFAASFFGMFELVLPSKWVNSTDKQADKGGLMGIFFMALTLVLVSFSCTAPFVGGLLVEAARGAVIKPVIGMLGFSLAFSLPFTLLAFFPSMMGKLPQSGGWLNSVKVVLAFLILAFGLKYLSAADQAYHWGLLSRDLFIAVWIVLAFLLGLYLLGKIKFSHDSDMNHIPVMRFFLAIVVFSFAVYLIPGLFGAPLKAVSGLMPPMSSHTFNIMEKDYVGGKTSETFVDQTNTKLCSDDIKYADFLHLPAGFQGYFDYDQGIACAKEQNKPVFLSFMGHACSKCHEMEAKVWPDPKVMQLLNEHFVIIALFTDDKSKLPENEWYTSLYDGKVKKTLGKKNLARQIDMFSSNGQPFYAILNPDGLSLDCIHQYDLKVDNFIAFLEKGLEKSGLKK